MSEIPNPISISGSSLVMFSVVAFALEEMILGWFRRRANQTLWKAHYIFAFIYISMWSGVSASDDCMFKFGVAGAIFALLGFYIGEKIRGKIQKELFKKLLLGFFTFVALKMISDSII